MAQPKRLRVCFHDNCFDGAASAALFTAFYRARVESGGPGAPGGPVEIRYRGMSHGPADVFPPGTFDGDDNAVVDFRWSPDPALTWWFDHHVSAFQSSELETAFRTRPPAHHHYDPTAPSCAGFLARTVESEYGFDVAPWAELIHWAEIIDSARFESPEAAVRLAEPALRLMTWVEHNKDRALGERFIAELTAARPLAHIAAEPWVVEPLEPVLAKHERSVEVVRARCQLTGGVVSFDVTEDGVEAYNKFIPYYLHPEAQFVVGLSALPSRLKISVGSNPWLPRTAVNIAAICERYGGGGHPVVGAISLPVADLARARRIAGDIAEELRERLGRGAG